VGNDLFNVTLTIADDGLDTVASWQELRFTWTGRRFSGWKVRVSLMNTHQQADDILFLDHLACMGSGDLLGAAFRFEEDDDDDIDSSTCFYRYYDSPLAEEQSLVDLHSRDGSLTLNNTIEQTEAWGGFNDYQHLAPGASYYNLLAATSISLDYEILHPSTMPERAHLRIILMDGSDCLLTAQLNPDKTWKTTIHFITFSMTRWANQAPYPCC